MATGLEILGAVAASIELVKLAKTGLAIFNDFRHANVIPTELEELHFRAVAQGLKFEWWCSTLGIQDMIKLEEQNSKWQYTKDFHKFDETLRFELRFRNEDMVKLTFNMVRSMNQKFEEIRKIFSRYFESTNSTNLEAKKSRLGSRWSKLSTKLKADPTSKIDPYAEGGNERTISTTASLSATARWLSTDKIAVNRILSAIESLNSSLMNLLHYSLGAQVNRRTNMAILDTADYQTLALIQRLPDESDLKPLASLKRWQLRAQKDDQDDATSNISTTTLTTEPSNSRIHTYPVQDFKRGTLRIGESRCLSTLDQQPVVVEWKYFSKDHPFQIEQSIRLANLVNILNRNDLFEKFMALPCKGLVSDTENSRIGIVFSSKGSDPVTLKTLRDTIRSTEKTPPPVGERFDLAKRFSLCISSLHSVRWLHKSIRSDNFICFKQSNAKPTATHTKTSILVAESAADVVNNDIDYSKPSTRPLTRAPEPLPPFHLLGWDLSRPDHPSELSETLSISTLGFHAKREVIQMYSHPEISLGSKGSPDRVRYRSQFDIYSLGLVLLEIGLWRTIDTLRSKCKNDADFRIRVQTEYCDKLQSKMGLKYWRAVQRCLNNDFDIGDKVSLRENDFSLQLAFEEHVVSQLEKCSA